MWIWFVVLIVLVGLAYIRIAPSDPARWHVRVPAVEDKDFNGGAIRVVDVDLEALNRVILEGGARLLAGSLADGHLTYVSRTRVMGFPDYTTVQRLPAGVAIYSRLRFGSSDMGVNRKRIERWLAQL